MNEFLSNSQLTCYDSTVSSRLHLNLLSSSVSTEFVFFLSLHLLRFLKNLSIVHILVSVLNTQATFKAEVGSFAPQAILKRKTIHGSSQCFISCRVLKFFQQTKQELNRKKKDTNIKKINKILKKTDIKEQKRKSRSQYLRLLLSSCLSRCLKSAFSFK